MVEALSKATFAALASSTILQKLASRYGLRRPDSFARRFVAGERLEDAIAVAQALERDGLMVSLDYLGERVSTRDAATSATRAYQDLVGAVAEAGVSRNLSLKLTQLGLDIDRATAIDNLRRVVDTADKAECFVRIDMESSAYTDETIDVFETLWSLGCRHIGIVIQAYLRRSREYVERMNALGARVRLVKGAYREPTDVAFQQKSEVDAAFIDLMQVLIVDGNYPAIATHDEAIIEKTRHFATTVRVPIDRFEFQMLYGVRRDLQRSLAAQGHPFRVYVPFGREWYAYFMRRLGERPANVGFVVRNIFGERESSSR
jgi:proline dehydrogenase